jgi:hypothetical protein
MRIVVVSPPRSGNHWVECLLGAIYGLQGMGASSKPKDTKSQVVRAWVAEGGFPDQTIFHLHCRFKADLCDVIEAVPAHIVTVVRDPYDAFVSRYYWTQERLPADREKAERRSRQRMVGRPLDDPEVLGFLADRRGFGGHLESALGWLHGGRATVIRYENLHRDPVAELTHATEAICPVRQEQIRDAIAACTAENMRKTVNAADATRRVRVAKVGDSREKLTEAHLVIFRDQYAEQIRSLGYEVR